MNNGRIKMREALGFTLYDQTREVIDGQILLGNFLNKDELKITVNEMNPELLKKKIRPKVATIYTGPPDVFFNFKYGKLDWRSLEFKFNTLKRNKIQECVQINFPNDYKYTRKVEIKHVTKQKSKYSNLSYSFFLLISNLYLNKEIAFEQKAKSHLIFPNIR